MIVIFFVHATKITDRSPYHTLFCAVNIDLESLKEVICNLNGVNIFPKVYVFTSSCFICAISLKIPMFH